MFFKKTNGNKTITNFIRMAAKKKSSPRHKQDLRCGFQAFSCWDKLESVERGAMNCGVMVVGRHRWHSMACFLQRQ
jgi:hypothetical protein